MASSSSAKFRFAPTANTPSGLIASTSKAPASFNPAPVASVRPATITSDSKGQLQRSTSNTVDVKGKARAIPLNLAHHAVVKSEVVRVSIEGSARSDNNRPRIANISSASVRTPVQSRLQSNQGSTSRLNTSMTATATGSSGAHVTESTSSSSRPKTVHASLPTAILARRKSPISSPVAQSTASRHFQASSRSDSTPALATRSVSNPQSGSRGEKRQIEQSINIDSDDAQDSTEMATADENVDPFRTHLPSKRSRPSIDSGYATADHSRDMQGIELVAPTPANADADEAIICDSEGEEMPPLTSEPDLPTASSTSHKARRHELAEAARQADRDKVSAGPSPVAATSSSNDAASLETVEMDLARLTNRRIVLLEESLELLNSRGTFTESGSDEQMLRSNLNYVAEKTHEYRATIKNFGAALSPLQQMLEKRAGLLEELIDLQTNGTGVSATGSDRPYVEHQLDYINNRIKDLRAQTEGAGAIASPRAVASPGLATAVVSNPLRAAKSSSTLNSVPRLSISSLPPLSLAAHATPPPPPPQGSVPRLPVPIPVPNSSGSNSSLNSATAKARAPRPPAKITSFRPAVAPATNSEAAPPFLPAAATNATSSVSLNMTFRPGGDNVMGPTLPERSLQAASTSRAAAHVANKESSALATSSETIVLEDDFAGINFDEPLTIDDDDEMIFVDTAAAGPSNMAISRPIRPAGKQVQPSKQSNQAETNSTTTEPSDIDPARALVAPKLKHPWSRDVSKALRQRFGLTGFRANQEEAINATLAGKDVFVLLPTGGGKSLCFQLPAVITTGSTKGVTIVVSPLLSLISDQTKALIDKDIPVVYLNSTMAACDRKFAMDAIRSDPPFACLAYVTPEQIVKSDAFRNVLRDLSRRRQLARFVIDEAHCVSSWGHDFRPDYKEMGSLKKDFPHIPMIALTATANGRVKNDVMSNLHMQSPLVLTQSFNRKNLRYEVRPKGKGVINDIATLIRTNFSRKCGIIYCMSKKQCEDTAKMLRDQYRIGAQHYHAGMNKDDRLRIQEGWQKNEFHVICATIAFGMGIDKPDVRYVIHYSLSQSLEAYYQETGRAGRDGVTSTCILFYAYGDTKLINRLIDEGEGTFEQKENNRANVRRVIQYCMNETDCRRVQVLRYFGDNDFTADMCHKTCDNCLAGRNVEKRDVTDIAKDAIRLVQSIEHAKGVTMLYAIDVFRGSKMAKITSQGHEQLPFAGKGAKMERGDVERLFQLLASEAALGERFERNALGFTHAYVIVGSKAQEILSGSRKVEMGMSLPNQKQGTIANGNATKQVPVTTKYTDDFEDESEDDDEAFQGAGRAQLTEYEEIQDVTSPAASTRGSTQKSKGSYLSDFDAVLAQLINIRAECAMAEDCLKTQFISDEALRHVAAKLPLTKEELVALPGCDDEDLYEWYLESGCRKVSRLARFGRASQTLQRTVPKSKTLPSTSCAPDKASTEPRYSVNASVSAGSSHAKQADRTGKPGSSKHAATGASKRIDLGRFALGANSSSSCRGKSGRGVVGGAIRPMPVHRK